MSTECSTVHQLANNLERYIFPFDELKYLSMESIYYSKKMKKHMGKIGLYE